MIMRYYDTATKTETHSPSDTTIPCTDPRVSEFFNELQDGYELKFNENNLPIISEKSELTAEELAAKEQRKINTEALSYLSETDWYVIRSQETGETVPQDILNKRQAARATIVKDGSGQ